MTTAGFIGLCFVSAYPLLMVSMVLLGFGTAFAYTPVISLLAGCFPQRRGSIIGMVNGGIGLGVFAASALVPWLNALHGSAGWRWACAVFAGTSIVAVAASARLLPGSGGSAGLRTAPAPSVLRNPRLVTVGLMYGLVGLTYIAQATFMYSFSLEAGLDPQTAGRLAALMGILSIFAAPAWGMISDRVGRARALMVAVTLNVIGTAIPVLLPTYAGFAAHYLILGCTVSGMFTSILAVAAESVEPQQAPRATSFVTMFYAVGQIVGPALAGVVIEQFGGFKVAFGLSCLILSSGIYLSWKLKGMPLRVSSAAV